MTIPFLGLFKKATARLWAGRSATTATEPAPPQPLPAPKPKEQRLSKTVMPSVARAQVANDHSYAADSYGKPAPRSGSFQSQVERTISLQLADILDQLPRECIKPAATFDTARGLVLRASEIEKGMASGKPSVPLASIYQQAPEIFTNEITPGDPRPVQLPFGKVLEQFQNVQLRADQMIDNLVPVLETPILKITMEDTERRVAPPQASSDAPAAAQSAMSQAMIAQAEPEAISADAARLPARPRITIPLSDLAELKRDAVPPVPAAKSAPKETSLPQTSQTPVTDPAPKTPVQLPPKGTGVPVFERVPASSGPPVPTPPSPPTVPVPPPFRINALTTNIRPKFTFVPGVEPPNNTETAEPESDWPLPPVAPRRQTVESEGKIALSLSIVLQALPNFQLSGSPLAVPDDVRIELPLPLIEPQLATGRVAIPATTFQRAMPETYRGLFVIDRNETPVLLPLQEVLKQLPEDTLRLRGDQHATAISEEFCTPFSIQAEEDAKRLQATQHDVQQSPEAKPDRTDPKEALGRANALPGIAACAIVFADGLNLAGNMPAELGADAVCAMAPSLLQKIDNHSRATPLGPCDAVTLYCAKAPLTFFMRSNICLAALHAGAGDLAAETREQAVAIVEELARTYSNPELAHVDH